MLFLLALYKLTTTSQRLKLLKCFKIVSLIVLLLNFKSLPLIYHLRYALYLGPLMRKLKRLGKESQLQLDSKRIENRGTGNESTTGKKKTIGYLTPIGEYHIVDGLRCMLDDLDLNIHMNNSSYNKTLDYIRISFFASTFGTSAVRPFILSHKIKSFFRFSKHQGSNPNECHKELYFANAGTMIWFLKSIQLWQGYSIKTKLLTWDNKWIWTVHYFIVQGDAKGKSKAKRKLKGSGKSEGKATETENDKGKETVKGGKTEQIVSVGLVKQCLKFKNGKTVNVWDALSWAGHDVFEDDWEELNAEKRLIKLEVEEYRLKGMEIVKGFMSGEVSLKDTA